MTNTELINKKIDDSGLKRAFIAKSMGITRQSFSAKINNKRAFNQYEIAALCKLLNITALTEKERIFFA